MTIHNLSALLAAILMFVIGWSVILRDRRKRAYFTFTILCFNLTFWYLGRFFAETLDSPVFVWISYLFAIAIPSTSELFFKAFLQTDEPWLQLPLLKRTLFATTVFGALLLVGLFYPIHHARPFKIALLVFVFGALSYCMYLIYNRQRSLASRPEATRLTYLFYGGIAAILLALTDSLPGVGVTLPTIGNIIVVIYMYFISQTLFHFRLLDIKELLGKMVILAVFVLTLSVIYGLLLSWVGPGQPGIFFFNTIVASFVIMALFEPLRHWVENRVNRWLFAEKYEFSRRLDLLSRDLVNLIQVQDIVERILSELEHSNRVTHASVYLAATSGGTYRLAGHVGPAPISILDSTTRRLFFERLRDRGLLTLEGLERELAVELAENKKDETAATRNILETMNDLQCSACFPLVLEKQVLGLLNLKDDRIREAYASDELEHLSSIAAQAAITLRNSQVYEQMKERDRLAALGQMAAGLAHEIRNPLGAIKGAAQLLTPENDAPHDGVSRSVEPESDEYVRIIIEEVNRLDRVVSQFLGYARPDRGGERSPLSVNEVVHKTLQLLRSQNDQFKIHSELAPDLPFVRGDAEQLRQVFLNLGINALQSYETPPGELWVTTRLRRSFRGHFVEVIFRDQGQGIPEDMLPNIFIPFFTTKNGGTGLGLPICQRIIESHRGTIEVASVVGRGSSFTVVLPVAEMSITQTGQTNSPTPSYVRN